MLDAGFNWRFYGRFNVWHFPYCFSFLLRYCIYFIRYPVDTLVVQYKLHNHELQIEQQNTTIDFNFDNLKEWLLPINPPQRSIKRDSRNFYKRENNFTSTSISYIPSSTKRNTKKINFLNQLPSPTIYHPSSDIQVPDTKIEQSKEKTYACHQGFSSSFPSYFNKSSRISFIFFFASSALISLFCSTCLST